MRVAVVTPFYRTPPDWLRQCHESVRAQTRAATHFLVCDGSDESPPDGFQGEFLRLGHNHADNGNTPRCAGAFSAAGLGFDAVAFLDADNWFAPDHLAGLLAVQAKTGALICTSGADLHALDGTRLGAHDENDGKNFADTSCLLLTRPAFPLLLGWVLMPPQFRVVCDRWFWRQVLRNRFSTAHTGQATLAFRSSYPHHYRRHGRTPPAGCKPESYLREVDRQIAALSGGDGA